MDKNTSQQLELFSQEEQPKKSATSVQGDLFPLGTDTSKPSLDKIELRIRKLETILNYHNKLYYDQASPEISDADYDKLFRELEELEAHHPQFARNDSPTKHVGGSVLSSFTQVEHRVPMLSIDDLFAQGDGEDADGELIDYYQRLLKLIGHDNFELMVEPKIDGVAVSLIYEEGKLIQAITRGDGVRGDDITQNVKTIRNIPRTLISKNNTSIPSLLEVRGEIFMENAAFAALNEERDEQGLPSFANPRNASAGTLKQLDSKEVAKRPLSFLAHGSGAYNGPPLHNAQEFITLLKDFRIPLAEPIWIGQGLVPLRKVIHHFHSARHALPYGTDGAVIKITDFSLRDQLGTTARAPRWAAAYKYPPEQKPTRLLNISIQVGRTGVLTPIAELEPVPLSGSTVSRATLHNQDEISKKDVRIGDMVLVEKAGEIIPAIVKVLPEYRPSTATPYSLFDAVKGCCPSCQHPIYQEGGFVAWKCINPFCPSQISNRLKQFASRKALNIDSLGEIVAEALVRRIEITSPLDLFTVNEEDFASLNLGSDDEPRRFGEKNARKVIEALTEARKAPLEKWLYALGIPLVGETTARELSRLHPDLESIAHSPILEKLAPLKTSESSKAKQQDPDLAPFEIGSEIGPAVAQSILQYFTSAQGLRLLTQFDELNLHPESTNFNPKPSENSHDGILTGKTFVITGTLSHPRADIEQLILGNGGKISSSISKNTSYLLAGQGGGSKRDKAAKLNIPLLTEDDLMALIDSSL